MSRNLIAQTATVASTGDNPSVTTEPVAGLVCLGDVPFQSAHFASVDVPKVIGLLEKVIEQVGDAVRAEPVVLGAFWLVVLPHRRI